MFCAAVLGVTQDPAANITSLLSCAMYFCAPSKSKHLSIHFVILCLELCIYFLCILRCILTPSMLKVILMKFTSSIWVIKNGTMCLNSIKWFTLTLLKDAAVFIDVCKCGGGACDKKQEQESVSHFCLEFR